MAVSVNGFVTGENDDTDWVQDTEILYRLIAAKGACVMGKRTYEEAKKFNAFPYAGAINIVLTHDKKLMSKSTENAIFTSATPGEVVTLLENKGYSELIVVGGGHVNTEFLRAGLINTLIIDVHPVIIDRGIRLFESEIPRTKLDYVTSLALDHGITQITFNVHT